MYCNYMLMSLSKVLRLCIHPRSMASCAKTSRRSKPPQQAAAYYSRRVLPYIYSFRRLFISRTSSQQPCRRIAPPRNARCRPLHTGQDSQTRKKKGVCGTMTWGKVKSNQIDSRRLSQATCCSGLVLSVSLCLAVPTEARKQANTQPD